jgi:hypothetical protein
MDSGVVGANGKTSNPGKEIPMAMGSECGQNSLWFEM